MGMDKFNFSDRLQSFLIHSTYIKCHHSTESPHTSTQHAATISLLYNKCACTVALGVRDTLSSTATRPALGPILPIE